MSAAYSDGFKVSGSLIVSGPDARPKALRLAEICWSRLVAELDRAGLGRPEATQTELVGDDSCHGRLTPAHAPAEILLRLSVRDASRPRLEVFRKLLPSLILSGPPGVAVTGGAPQISEVVSYWPCLVPRDAVLPQIEVWEQAAGAAEPSRVASRGPLAWLDVCAPEPAAPPARATAPPRPRAWGAKTVAHAPPRPGPRAQRRQGRHGQHRSRRPQPGVLRLARPPRDGRAGEGLVPGPGRRDPCGATCVPNLWALNFLLERRARRRRHAQPASRRPGQDARAGAAALRGARSRGGCSTRSAARTAPASELLTPEAKMRCRQSGSHSRPLRVERHDHGVHHLVLARPAARNALDAAMIAELTQALDTLAALPGPELRLLVLRGEGEVLCSGADLGYMRGAGRPRAGGEPRRRREAAGRLPAPGGAAGAGRRRAARRGDGRRSRPRRLLRLRDRRGHGCRRAPRAAPRPACPR